MHREMLTLQLERLQLIDAQIAKLNNLIAQGMKPHQEAVMRLAEVPGLGVDSATWKWKPRANVEDYRALRGNIQGASHYRRIFREWSGFWSARRSKRGVRSAGKKPSSLGMTRANDWMSSRQSIS